MWAYCYFVVAKNSETGRKHSTGKEYLQNVYHRARRIDLLAYTLNDFIIIIQTRPYGSLEKLFQEGGGAKPLCRPLTFMDCHTSGRPGSILYMFAYKA